MFAVANTSPVVGYPFVFLSSDTIYIQVEPSHDLNGSVMLEYIDPRS